jgi:crossover junction endodeoxyribonuclease RuvC
MDKFIFAIDPSINNVGWCYLFCHNKKMILLDSGIFHNKLETLLDKMNYIFTSLREKIQSINIDAIIVEETLVNINPFTSLKLSKGQSSAITASFNHNVPLYVYSCKSPRKGLLHNGNADKKEGRRFVENLLGKVANEHVADAILLGYYHHFKINNFLEEPVKPPKKSKKKLKINGELTQQLVDQSKTKKSKKKLFDGDLVVNNGENFGSNSDQKPMETTIIHQELMEQSVDQLVKTKNNKKKLLDGGLVMDNADSFGSNDNQKPMETTIIHQELMEQSVDQSKIKKSKKKLSDGDLVVNNGENLGSNDDQKPVENPINEKSMEQSVDQSKIKKSKKKLFDGDLVIDNADSLGSNDDQKPTSSDNNIISLLSTPSMATPKGKKITKSLG